MAGGTIKPKKKAKSRKSRTVTNEYFKSKWFRENNCSERVSFNQNAKDEPLEASEDTSKPRFEFPGDCDADLWNLARNGALGRYLEENRRLYRAAPPRCVRRGPRTYDCWYITTFERLEGGKMSFRQDILSYPRVYTGLLQKLNRWLRTTLLGLAGDDSVEAVFPPAEMPWPACFAEYLFLLRECFTAELWRAARLKTMSATWRSVWLNEFAHRERMGLSHCKRSRAEFMEQQGPDGYLADPFSLGK